jgi:hypothetical protein
VIDAGHHLDANPLDAAPDAPFADAQTTGSCGRFLENGTSCDFAGECEQISAGGCREHCFCSPIGQTRCVFLDSAECAVELCPASAPHVGEASSEPPTVVEGFDPGAAGHTLDCIYGSSECPQRCDSYPDSNSATGYSWRCTTPAGPSCPPSACPISLPTNETCTDWGVVCSWAGDFGCRLDCTCSTNPFDPAMSCVRQSCDCPAVAPSPLDACPPAPYRAICTYPTDRGSGSTACDCGIGLNTHWSCRDPNIACPSSPPTGPCVAGVDPTDCGYDASPYCGRCGCGSDGNWTCSPSTCSACPASKPMHMTACTEEQIGQICRYGNFGPSQTSCSCIGPSPMWSCSDGAVP